MEITDAHLSKNLKILVEAGYAAVTKEASRTRADARRLTWITITQEGKKVFDQHVKALENIANGIPS